MELTRWNGRLITVTVVTTTLLMTAVLFLRPPFGLVPAGAGGPDGTSRAPETPPSLVVVPGDGQIRVSWPEDGGSPYHVDASPEGGGAPTPCRPVAASPPLVSTCLLTGLINGAGYLVSVYRGTGGTASLPVRTRRAVPRPALLASADTTVWLDPSNYGALGASDGRQPVLGSSVAVIRDQSAHGRMAVQAEPTRRPVLDQLGRLSALRFDGGDSLLLDARGFPNRTSTVVVVAAQDDPRPDLSCFRHIVAWGVQKLGQARILHKGCNSAFAFAETFGTWQQQVPRLMWPTGQPAVISAVFAGDGTMARIDETESYRWNAPPDTRRTVGPGDLAAIGAAPWDLQAGWKGRIGELMVFARVLTTAEIKSVEDYLTTKWQVTGKPDA
ncbi:MAG TPA: hypothetical protein VI248_05050 [Kineosporiaceae bacterium]